MCTFPEMWLHLTATSMMSSLFSVFSVQVTAVHIIFIENIICSVLVAIVLYKLDIEVRKLLKDTTVNKYNTEA